MGIHLNGLPTTREECEIEVSRIHLDDLLTGIVVEKCMKTGVVGIALRRSSTLERLAPMLTPPFDCWSSGYLPRLADIIHGSCS
jgi:hypothetical protein